MDWENKFYSIVKETDKNLAKAKEKLSGKFSSNVDKFPVETVTARTTHTNRLQQNQTPTLPPDILDLNMSADFNVQLLHLQEQIDYQNRTIEKLQRLVVSLNSEKSHQKEQISQLKDDMNKLTDKTSSHYGAANSERQASAMKRELMYEIDKVKVMLKSVADEALNPKRSTFSSSSLNEDFWAMKESLMENMDRVHREINAVSKRLEKLESPIGTEQRDRPMQTAVLKNDHYTDRFQRPPVLYTPAYKSIEEVSSLGVQQLRQTVNSLNSKLDSLEKKLDTTQQQQLLATAQQWPGLPKHSYTLPSTHKGSLLEADNDDLNSLSDLSDISSLSGNNTDDSIDAPALELQGMSTLKQRTRIKKPSHKTGRTQKGKVNFDLSDSDIDEVDLETDSLDLDN